ncbi:MAG: uracil-DNA glycosylase [Planctomycetota bacterium]|nr:uracil-DNA glycosylase [Planctomycetota bacterium]
MLMNIAEDSLRRLILSSLKKRLLLEAHDGDGQIPAADSLIPPPNDVVKPHEPAKKTQKPKKRRTSTPLPKLESRMSDLHDKPITQPKYTLEEKREMLANLASRLEDCHECGVNPDRNRMVFGDGSLEPKVMFVGEAPGADEDEQGIPFVGRAGKLLTDMIEKGMKISRDETYICNVLKCRPPSNRTPSPEEAAICAKHLERQIEIIRPPAICTLGASSLRYLLSVPVGRSLGSMRGDVHDYRGIPLIATYHPSYLLRDPSKKREAWKDLQLLMRTIGLLK